jgi:hypothetical protein
MPPDYVDDEQLADDAVLWRAINPTHHIRPDLTVSSAAYSTNGLSVYVIAETSALQLAAKFAGWPFQSFTVKVARDAGCIVCRIPDSDGDTSHREIHRKANPGTRLNKTQSAKLRDAAVWVYQRDVPVPQAPALLD